MTRPSRFLVMMATLLAWPALAQNPATPADERIAAIRKLMSEGKHRDAERLARVQLAQQEAAGQGESLETARILDHLAEAMLVNGEAADPEAKAVAERAIRIKEKTLGPEHPEYAVSLKHLAHILQQTGNMSAARARVEQALTIERKALGPEHPAVGATLSDLAVILYNLGDFAEAKNLLEQALPLAVKRYGPESTGVAQNLNDRAVMLWKLGQYGQAKALHEHALAIREKEYGPDHFQVAASLNNLAAVLDSMHDVRGAVSLQKRALAIREKALGADHPNIANGLTNLAYEYLQLREFETARGLIERGMRIRDKVYGPRHPLIAESLDNLAVALRGQGNRTAAFEAALRSEEIVRNHLRVTLRTLSEREAATALAMRSSGLSISLAMLANGGLPEAARGQTWDALIRSRSLVFDEMAARRRSTTGEGDAETAMRAAGLDRARAAYARLLIQGPARQAAAKHATAIDAARHDMERAERELAERSRQFRNQLAQGRVGFEEVAASLPAGSALVGYVEYAPDYFAEARSYFAFVLPAGRGAPAAVALASAKEIDGLVSAWRAEIAREAAAPGRSSIRNERQCRAAGTALRRKIWDPIAAHLGGAKRVFLVLDGALHLVNFAALPSASDGYLVERGPLLHVLNTERDLVEQDQGVHGEGLLAVGDPDFQLLQQSAKAGRQPGSALRGTTCAELEKLRFARLPQSAIEIGEVAAIWQRAGSRTSSLHQAGATKAAFRDAAPGKRVLHLATHGFFVPSQCGAKATNPRPISGLALAGANRRGGNDEPGILTADEVPSLQLDGVEWAVLSGCDTGLGAIQAGEGVFGMRRAFQIAGVHTVIMSLWPVQDDAARQWMSRLYRARFLSKLGTPESVQRASAGLLRERRAHQLSTHPFYWAAFIAAGDWR